MEATITFEWNTITFHLTNFRPPPTSQKRMKMKRRSKFTKELPEGNVMYWYLLFFENGEGNHIVSRLFFDLAYSWKWIKYYESYMTPNICNELVEKGICDVDGKREEVGKRGKGRVWGRRRVRVEGDIRVKEEDVIELARDLEVRMPCDLWREEKGVVELGKDEEEEEEEEKVRFEEGERQEWFRMDMIDRGEGGYVVKVVKKKRKGKRKTTVIRGYLTDVWDKHLPEDEILPSESNERETWVRITVDGNDGEPRDA
ncbi:hypothetical protein QBC38DRAFT_461256 [Podospora fimiseda]|uniref:Uncharacterized protein n=1 Tax=Podospora fimiseda TaxID=252190 RepID=A0AAN6YSD8_9PEZI|nr:hypothetical protein QBC38DRAFT_461256 [Podospora fimiseda]